MKLNKHLIIIGSVILLVLGSLIWQSTQQSKPRQLGGDFTLPTSTGDLTLSDFRGQAVMLFFGYTSCPDVCPANMATMRQVLNNLSPELNGKVKGLFVTVDPERDSLAHVASYAAFFHADIAAAGGSKAGCCSYSSARLLTKTDSESHLYRAVSAAGKYRRQILGRAFTAP